MQSGTGGDVKLWIADTVGPARNLVPKRSPLCSIHVAIPHCACVDAMQALNDGCSNEVASGSVVLMLMLQQKGRLLTGCVLAAAP